MAKITIKNNPGYNGIDFGVPFVNGVAETDDAWLVTMFKEKGYNVEESAAPEEIEAEEAAEEAPEDVEAEPKKKTTRKATKAEE